MILSSVIALAATAGTAAPLKLTATGASLFKNGYAVVIREAPLGASGEYTLEEFPSAVLGTMWLTASPGVKLKEAVVTSVETATESGPSNMDELLSANVGKVLIFTLQEKETLTGKLESASGDILIITTDVQTRVIYKRAVTQIAGAMGEVIWKIKRTGTKRVMRLQAETPGSGKLVLVSLERGLTWSPAYSLDISNEKTLELVSKATILNDLVDLNGVELRLVTGFPNIPFLGFTDPFTWAANVDNYISAMMQAGTPDAFRRDRGIAMQQNAAKSFGGFDDAFEPSQLPGFQAEDLFFYRQPNVRLKKGDRGYYILFSAESSYEHIYEWEIPDHINETAYVAGDDRPGDVWHSLKFKNTSKQPLTTAVVTTFKNGEILGQDMLNYTSVGAEAVAKITKAMDVRAEDAEQETARERNSKDIRGTYYDLVTLKGTLRIQNRKAQAVKLKITKFLTGEVLSADAQPEITAIARGLSAVNPKQRLVWTLELKPAQKRELTYTYRVYINR